MAVNHYTSEIINVLQKKGSIRAANLNAQLLLSQVTIASEDFIKFLKDDVNSTYMLFPIKCNSRIMNVDIRLSAPLTGMSTAGKFKFVAFNKPINPDIEFDISNVEITTSSTGISFTYIFNSDVIWNLMATQFNKPSEPIPYRKFNAIKNQTNYYLGIKLTTKADGNISTHPIVTISVQMTHASPSEMSLSSVSIPVSNY